MLKHLPSAFKSKKSPNDKACDLVLTVGDDGIRVHTSVMRSKSVYFGEMFPKGTSKDDKDEKSLEVQDAEIEAVTAVVDFIYSKLGEVNATVQNVEDIVRLSRKWKLEGLENKCSAFLEQNIDEKSCVAVKHLSQNLEYKDLEAQSDKFMFENLDKVAEDGNVQDLEQDEIADLLKDYPGPKGEYGLFNLKARDSVMWSALTQWAQHDEDDLMPLFCQMFRDCDLCCHDLSFIEDEVLTNDHVMECEACRSHVTTCIIDALDHRIAFQQESAAFALPGERACFCDPECCFFVLSVARDHGREDIEAKVEECITQNFATVSQTEGFKNLDMAEFVRYLSSPAMESVPEIVIWSAAVGWVKHKRERRADFLEIFKLINLEALPQEFLQNTVSREELVSSSVACKDILIATLFSSMGRGGSHHS